MRVKMCGMKTLAAARAAEEAGADYVGFIFAEGSKRYIVPAAAREIARELRHVKKVGVFVDAPMDAVNEIAAFVGLDYVQLHGHESADMAKQAEYPVIKAYRYGDDFDAAAANAYPAEIILVDSYVAGAAGGTGTAFGWQEAARAIARITKLVLIAGGITTENVGEAAEVFHPFGVDVSGGLEEDGEKSEAKIRAFMAAVRACD
ncbi:phosphoribosylanthranilate isomerase [Selenomonas sp. oral taxon 138]|uniref:phosphoribosylanthranilate isomerase n=1 Tax=Selenomonas sp. oral taxon 138 TaxID=712532 RepID=UPI0002A3FAF5|nr:phosphoribosylanthranilate isomerase [Selenomonas sp. oral taxon 138]EKX95314.1 N-(5'phosphoribosyl)anthranilate isomerase [Selenomonas sp. oral taxon 138 str. F0429]